MKIAVVMSITNRTAELGARKIKVEWATVALLVVCYALWLGAGALYATLPIVAIPLLAATILLHSSLQHEAIHRHPTRRIGWNEALVWLPLGVIVPYRRFREQHLAHHLDARLTDPYDDPESFYLPRSDWQRMPRMLRALMAWNNVLAVRMLLGPAISTAFFVRAEAKALLSHGRDARRARVAWAHHCAGLAVLGLIVHSVFAMPLAVYFAAAYLARTVLAVRSYCEHQWADTPQARTVIVERSLLGWLFLNNNLHVVHHAHPALAWHALPAAYRARRAHWQAVNGGYVFRGYGAVLWRFAFAAKEPVAHPVR
jgi:fatty acid desaturase